MTDLYDAEYEVDFATIIANEEALSASSLEESHEKAHAIFSKTLQKRALNFLQNLEKKIEELSNQDVANLLTSLLASGLNIENEEELEYWISILESQALHRVLEYVAFSSITYQKDENSKKKYTKNVREFSSKEIENFEDLVQIAKLAHRRKEPTKKDSDEYRKWLEKEKMIKRVENIIKKDIEEKRKEEKQHSQKKEKNNDKKEIEVDSLGILKGKMLSAGVESNGEYWNDVISSHDASPDQLSFTQKWSADYGRIEGERSASKEGQGKMDELRGIKKEGENSRSSEKSSQNNSQNMSTSNSSSGGQSR